MTRQNRRSPTNLPHRLAKVLTVPERVQDGMILSGRIQADEMMYPAPDSDAKECALGRKSGFSRNQS